MAHNIRKAGPTYFSPLTVRIENKSLRPKQVRVFDAKFAPGKLMAIKLMHPHIPYGELCSLLQIVQLKVNRTQIIVLKGTEQQLMQAVQLVSADAAGEAISINLPDTIRLRGGDGIVAAHTTNLYRVGARQLMPAVLVLPKTTIELSFFIPGGLVPPANKNEVHAKATQ